MPKYMIITIYSTHINIIFYSYQYLKIGKVIGALFI
jgi:hypothetical protein